MNRSIYLIVLSSAVLISNISAFKYEDCGTDIGKVTSVRISGCDHLKKYCEMPEHAKQTIEIGFTVNPGVTVKAVTAAGNVVVKGHWGPDKHLPVTGTKQYPCDDPKSGLKCPLSGGQSYKYKGIVTTSVNTIGTLMYDVYFRLREKESWDIIACVKFKGSHYILDEKMF